MTKSDSENRWQFTPIQFLCCSLSALCILSFPFSSHAMEPDTYVPDPAEPVYEEMVPDAGGGYFPDMVKPIYEEMLPDTDAEMGMEQTGEEMTVEEKETKELQKRELLEDYKQPSRKPRPTLSCVG